MARRFPGPWLLALLLCACGGDGEERVPLPGTLAPAVPLPADPRGEAAGVVDFGRVELGRHAEAAVYLTNPGDEGVRLEPPPPVGPFFATVPPGGLLLEPGERAPLELAFAPRVAGSAEGLLSLRAGEGELLLRLVGEGVGVECRLAAPPFDFGRVPVGTVAEGRVAVRAVGEGPCVLEEAVVSGEGFSRGAGWVPGAELLPGGPSLQVAVRFRPEGPGLHAGTLRIVAGPASVEVALTGAGE